MNSSERVEILLDSTYLFPIIGVEIEDAVETLTTLWSLYREGRARYHYTPFNILEILGKLSRIRYKPSRVEVGLHAIEEEFNLAYPTTEGLMKALNLKNHGYKDLIDLLLYVTSLTRKIRFLTRDYILIRFLEEMGENTNYILREKDFIKRYNS